MGLLSGKPQANGGLESEGKRWVIAAGIPLLAPLKPRYTVEVDNSDGTDDEEFPTTPRSEEARIPVKLTCPAAPRKRKPSLRCNYSGVREFFITPPDLETVFVRHVERAYITN